MSTTKFDWKSEEDKRNVVNQFEALRRNGSNNMLHFTAVQREAFDARFFNFVNCFGNRDNNYTSFLFSFDEFEDLIDEDLVNELMDKLN